MEFFRVYETSFQKNYAGKEHFSGLGNVLDSALAEFSFEFYVLFFLLSALVMAMNIALYRWEKKTDIQEVIEFYSDLFLFRALRLLIPPVCYQSRHGPGYRRSVRSAPTHALRPRCRAVPVPPPRIFHEPGIQPGDRGSRTFRRKGNHRGKGPWAFRPSGSTRTPLPRTTGTRGRT